VLFRIGGKQFYRSRIVFKNLNPCWEERFTIPIEDPFKPIQILVFDYDRGMNDDFMGMTSIVPTQLDLSASVLLLGCFPV
jgi:Ca2+-dependent lipid-binding protein